MFILATDVDSSEFCEYFCSYCGVSLGLERKDFARWLFVQGVWPTCWDCDNYELDDVPSMLNDRVGEGAIKIKGEGGGPEIMYFTERHSCCEYICCRVLWGSGRCEVIVTPLARWEGVGHDPACLVVHISTRRNKKQGDPTLIDHASEHPRIRGRYNSVRDDMGGSND